MRGSISTGQCATLSLGISETTTNIRKDKVSGCHKHSRNILLETTVSRRTADPTPSRRPHASCQSCHLHSGYFATGFMQSSGVAHISSNSPHFTWLRYSSRLVWGMCWGDIHANLYIKEHLNKIKKEEERSRETADTPFASLHGLMLKCPPMIMHVCFYEPICTQGSLIFKAHTTPGVGTFSQRLKDILLLLCPHLRHWTAM